MTNAHDPIPQITRDEEAAGSGDLVACNVARLKGMFPEIVTDGKVDFDVLRELLGDVVEDGEERYGLNWKGKRKARAFALTPSLGTLRPVPDQSVDWATTKNLLIEGDNLESLKLLRRSYAGQVKLIYIDPPYNTGNDFVYKDNYKDSIQSYLNLTGQLGDAGQLLVSEDESGGRFHTTWLTMLYPRLMLAKELLSDEGLMAVSIDEGEVHHMREMLDEIFGQECFVGEVVWEKIYTTKNDAAHLSNSHESILLYFKSAKGSDLGLLPRTAEMDARYTNPDNDPRGPWKAIPYYARGERKNGRYMIASPATGKEHWPEPDSHWRSPTEETARLIADNRIYFGKDGNSQPNFKRFLSEISEGIKVKSLWRHSEVGSNDSANAELKKIFEVSVNPFSFPKPTSLMRRLIQIGTGKDSIVMDFFAGSGSMAHACMAKNAEDGGERRYILVQLPEALDPSDKDQKTAADYCDNIGRPRNLAELTKERLRRAGKKIREEYPDAKIDVGFRVYKLATSNLKPWQPDAENLEASILDAVDNVLPGRTEDDLLVELLLKTGIDLTLLEEKRSIAGKTVHALGGGTLMVCLSNVDANDAEALGQGMADWIDALDPVQTTVYFKDTGLGADGNRAATKANLAAILRQRLGDRIAKIASI